VADTGFAAAARGAEVAFLMAGSSTPASSEAAVHEALEGSVGLVVTTLDALARAGVRRVVVASSGGTVYGPVSEVPTPEDHPTRPVSLHGMHSLAIEGYADYYARRHGTESVLLRFSNVYGPGQRSRGEQGVIAAWCEAALADRPIRLMGEGETRRDFVHAEDAAAAAALAGLDGPPGTFNVGGDASWSLEQLRAELERALGRPLRVERTPARPVDVPETHLDIARIERAVGWRPTIALPDGLRATLSAYGTPVGSS
jgi:UDP-glucose 4-epimerase